MSLAAVTRVSAPNPDDEMLVRLRNGDPVALTELFAAFTPRIRQQVLRYVRSPEDAEEIAQDVLVKVWRKLHAFRGDAAFSSWVHRITFNTAMSRLRNKRVTRPREVSAESARQMFPDQHPPAVALEVADWSSMADEDVLRGEMWEKLSQAIAVMPAIYRTPVVLRDLGGMSIEEVSSALKLNKQTLKSRVHRGRQFLRRRLGAFSNGLLMHRRESVASQGRTLRP